MNKENKKTREERYKGQYPGAGEQTLIITEVVYQEILKNKEIIILSGCKEVYRYTPKKKE